jgi:DNA-binding protein H-NS
MRCEGAMEKKSDFEAMDFDRLWLLYEDLTKVLAEKIAAEKIELEKRLAQLNSISPIGEATRSPLKSKADRPRRKYPKVLPKYFNPSAPAETWSGRGKQPRWLVAALRSGSKLDDFLIANAKSSGGAKLRRRRNS